MDLASTFDLYYFTLETENVNVCFNYIVQKTTMFFVQYAHVCLIYCYLNNDPGVKKSLYKQKKQEIPAFLLLKNCFLSCFFLIILHKIGKYRRSHHS